MRQRLTRGVVFVATLCLLAAAGDLAAQDGSGAGLAIGTPDENIGSSALNGGAVNVLYGATDGLSAWGNQYWTQNLGLAGTEAEHWDRFGSALAAGDFNGDGYSDLAVGAAEEDIGGVYDGGAVHIIYGTATWLTDVDDQYFNETGLSILDGAETSDQFGFSLEVGNFNDDEYDDLAIGVPYEDANGVADSGAVVVMYGAASGLTDVGLEIWDQGDLSSGVEVGDHFGYAMAAGDFDEDGYEDLAVSAPGEDVAIGVSDSGAVNILWGVSGGLTATHPTKDMWPEGFLHQDRAIISQDQAEAFDFFGHSLAAGDFNRDGNADLAIGVPYEDIESVPAENGGALHILYGTTSGFIAATTTYFHQNTTDINGIVEEGDRFAEVLEVGDFNGDGTDDLAIGVPHEDWLTGEEDCGIIQILWGAAGSGLAGWDQMVRQDLLELAGLDEGDDRFGTALAAGDFDDDGFDDLAVGAPGQTNASAVRGGMVFVLPGGASGLSMANQAWVQGYGGVIGGTEEADEFGTTLTAFPARTVVFYDGFEYGNTNGWSSVTP